MDIVIVSIPDEYERKRNICEFEMHLKKFFVCALSNYDRISA